MFNLGVETELYVFAPESLERADGYLEPMARSAQLKPTQAYDVEADARRDAVPRPDGRGT